VLLEGKEISPGSSAYVHVRLREPSLFVPGDRFIIRQFSPVTTIGGGVVLDSGPPKSKAGDNSAITALQILQAGSPAEKVELLVARAGEATPSSIAAAMGLLPSDVLQLSSSFASQKRIIVLGNPPNLLVHERHFSNLAERLQGQLKSLHTANQLVAGFPKEDLRGKLTTGKLRVLPSNFLYNALLQHLSRQGSIVVEGESVRLQGQGVQLNSEDVTAQKHIANAFEKAGLNVPSAREVLATLRLDRGRAEKLLKLLVKERVLHKVTEDLIFHQSALANLRGILAQRKSQSDRLSVPDFKQLTGVSRKFAIPLLEYLDRERVTRREGDLRIIL
jgi:selenocysteine-specific elongation factor